jgi:hypothetical protein
VCRITRPEQERRGAPARGQAEGAAGKGERDARPENEEGAHTPVDHAHKVRVRAAGGPTSPASASRERASSLRAVRLSARAAREGRQARVPAPPRARALTASDASCALAAAASPSVSRAGMAEGARGERVCRAMAREVDARRGHVCAEY